MRTSKPHWVEKIVQNMWELKQGKVQNMDPWSMDPLRGQGPWTRSIKIWTGSMDPFHGPGPWTPYHGPGPWTPYFCNKNKISKLKKKMNSRYNFKLIVIKNI